MLADGFPRRTTNVKEFMVCATSKSWGSHESFASRKNRELPMSNASHFVSVDISFRFEFLNSRILFLRFGSSFTGFQSSQSGSVVDFYSDACLPR